MVVFVQHLCLLVQNLSANICCYNLFGPQFKDVGVIYVTLSIMQHWGRSNDYYFDFIILMYYILLFLLYFFNFFIYIFIVVIYIFVTFIWVFLNGTE